MSVSCGDGSGDRCRRALGSQFIAMWAAAILLLSSRSSREEEKVTVPLAQRSVKVCQKLPLRFPEAAVCCSSPTDVHVRESGVTLLAPSTAWCYFDNVND